MMKNVHFSSPVVVQRQQHPQRLSSPPPLFPPTYLQDNHNDQLSEGDNYKLNFNEVDQVEKVTIKKYQVDCPISRQSVVSTLPSLPPLAQVEHWGQLGHQADYLNVKGGKMPVPFKLCKQTAQLPHQQPKPIKFNGAGGKDNGSDVTYFYQNLPLNNFNCSGGGGAAGVIKVNGVNNIGSLENFDDGDDDDVHLNTLDYNVGWPVSESSTNPVVSSSSRQLKLNSEQLKSENCSKVNGGGSSSASKTILNWLSFGKLKKGSRKSGNCTDKQEDKQIIKKKRSSCPPLGHPILMAGVTGNGGGGDRLNFEMGGGGGGGDGRGDQGNKQEELPILEDDKVKVITLDKPNDKEIIKADVSSRLPPRSPSSSKSPHPRSLLQNPSSSQEEDLFSINFERILEGIMNSDPVSSNPSNRNGGDNGNTTSISEEGPPFLEQVELEEEPDTSFIQAMEHKKITSSSSSPPSSPASSANDHHPHPPQSTTHAISLIIPPTTKQKSATIPLTAAPLVQKPPKPPMSSSSSSKTKYFGMRYPIMNTPHRQHHQHHHLLSSSSNASSSSTREAMLELASKLVSFRETLHHSREQLAMCHLTSLDEIHRNRKLPRTTTSHESSSSHHHHSAIDLQRRSLPPTRHHSTSTSTTTSPAPAQHEHGQVLQQYQHSSSTEKNINSKSAVNFPPPKKSNFDENYWERCVASAKINLGGSLHHRLHHHQDPLQITEDLRSSIENLKIRQRKDGDRSSEKGPTFGRQGAVLETDLDQLENGTGGYQAEWKDDENFERFAGPRAFSDKVDNFIGGVNGDFNCWDDGSSGKVNCGVEGGEWRDDGDDGGFGGTIERGGGTEGDHDKLGETAAHVQLCVSGEDTKKLTKQQLNKQLKRKLKNLSLQNLSDKLSELSEGGGIMATLKAGGTNGGGGGNGGGNEEDRRRSMEFLLDTDKEKNAHLRPPENSLQKAQGTTSSGSERRLSEHELRIQRSLQKLNVPDWYKNYNPPTAPSSTQSSCANTPSKGTLPRGESPFSLTGSNTGLAGGWPGLGSSSKTSSLTSLRYSGSKTGFGATSTSSRHKVTSGGAMGATSLMSPSSSQASCSPSPNFERSSFTYGMPYALTRFAAARMSCGASPASLSPSPSPVGGGIYHPQNITSSTSTPVTSGPSAAGRYGHGYQKTPYLGWRSQERLSSKSLYRSPAERLAADLIKNKPQTPVQAPAQVPVQQASTPLQYMTPPITQVQQATPPVSQQASLQSPQGHQEVEAPSPTTPSLVPSQVTSATASDLSLNSDESNSHKLNRVRSSIKEVSNAICDYVDELKPLDEQGMNGGRASPRRGLVWLESSFVGTKPIDSPSTPDTPSTQFMRSHQSHQGAAGGKGPSHSHFRFDTHELASSTTTSTTAASKAGGQGGGGGGSGGGGGDGESTSSTSHYTSYIGRNEQMVEERSGSSSVSSPTLEDILDSLLALRRPNKKFRSPTNSNRQGHELSQSATSPTPPTLPPTHSSSKVPYDPISTSTGEDLSSTTTGSHPYSATASSTGGATYGSSSGGNTRTFDEYLSSDTPTGSPRHRHKSSAADASAPSTTTTSTAYQSSYQYPTTLSSDQTAIPTTTTTSTEIYSRGGGGDSSPYTPSSGGSSYYHRSYQSDWQDRMNQPLPDATYLPPTTTSYSTSTPSGGAAGGGDSHTTISSSYTSRYSGGGGGDSPASSVHSTPTHQQYNRSSSALPPGGAGSAADLPKYKEKDYTTYTPYSSASSCHSSPAKSILGGATSTRDSNELVDCTPRRGYAPTPSNTVADEEDAELAFGNPTDIPAPITTHQRGQPPPPLNTNGGGGGSSAPSTVAPLQGGVIVNPLTGLSEYSNPPTPQRHRRVSFDLDFSDKEEKSSSRSRNKEENVGGTIQCRNTKCVKTATGLEARREFKVCHNCNAYYCSRECRRAHWEKHKKTCMQSRVGAICKQIISHVKEDSYVMNQLSTTAKRGFLAKGRGSVKLFFNSPDRAERFLTGGLPELPEPLYIPVSDMLPEEMGPQTFSELSDQCKSYNTDTRFVLYACVCVVNEVPTYGAVKWERELISRCSKLRLLLPRQFFEENQRTHHHPSNPAHHLMQASPTHQGTAASSPSPSGGGGDTPSQTNGSPSHQAYTKTPAPSTGGVPLYDSVPMAKPPGGNENPPPPLPPHHQQKAPPPQQPIENESGDTLILRSVPAPSTRQLTPKEQQRHREVSFANIQKHLLLRGVDLKKTYPDIFTKLCRYVEMDEPFLPVTIYPKNQDTGKQFVCVIMPECSESNYSLANQEATIAAAVASAAAYTADYDPKKGSSSGGVTHHSQRSRLQRVETINISEAGDQDYYDDDQIDLT